MYQMHYWVRKYIANVFSEPWLLYGSCISMKLQTCGKILLFVLAFYGHIMVITSAYRKLAGLDTAN